jgi:hypothetical protein
MNQWGIAELKRKLMELSIKTGKHEDRCSTCCDDARERGGEVTCETMKELRAERNIIIQQLGGPQL